MGSSEIRSSFKRIAPRPIRDAVRAIRRLGDGPPIEAVALRDYPFTPDSSSRVRVSLVLPTLHPKDAFGGVNTGMALLFELVDHLRSHRDVDCRILAEDDGGDAGWGLLEAAGAGSVGLTRSDVIALSDPADPIPVRSNDLFMTFNWWTTLNTAALARKQSSHFGIAGHPLMYLIQDHEPGFYPFSAAHMLARQAIDPDWPTIGIYNSHELHEYCLARDEVTARSFVFEPTMSPTLRPHLASITPQEKRLRIVVYGRPTVPRNCFSVLSEALNLWSLRNPDLSDWEVVSVGTPHRPIKCDDGRIVRSLGKLSLHDYAHLLRSSSVGVSLMASPHPSYPPLEMAHFGMRVITNTYANKDLSTCHPNIVSVHDVEPSTIAVALAEACHQFETDLPNWVGAETGRPSYLADPSFACVSSLADVIAATM